MANIFIVSDTHFGQRSICHFLNVDGQKMRPWDEADEMDEALIANWNAVVRPQDKVYHLGDVAMKRDKIALLGRCNGHKRLVRGNHDIFPMKYYLPFFEEIYGTRILDNVLLSHFPIHPESINKKWMGMAHGHVHNNVRPLFYGPRYLNVSIEVTNFAPISLDEIKVRLRKQQEVVKDAEAEGNI